MDQAVRFDLSALDLEPPELNPKFLKFGGELNNGLGSSFSTIRWDEPLPFAVSDQSKPASNNRNDPATQVRVSRHFSSKQARYKVLLSACSK
jgi:hypothetical protein